MNAYSLSVAGGCLTSTSNRPAIDGTRATRSALLVVDLQRDFLQANGRMPVAQEQVAPLLTVTNGLVARAQSAGIEVIYIRNAFSRSDYIGNLLRGHAAIVGSAGAELDPRVQVAGAVFTKSAPDAFSSDAFDKRLREQRIGHLYVTGLFADQCVYWTTRGALNRGYRVTVIPEGVAAASAADRDQALVDLREAGGQVLAAGAYRHLFDTHSGGGTPVVDAKRRAHSVR